MTNEPTQEDVRHEQDKMRRVARIDTLHETANQLIGALVAQENAATNDEERARLRDERLEIRRQTQAVDPSNDGSVDDLVNTWAARIREHRGLP